MNVIIVRVLAVSHLGSKILFEVLTLQGYLLRKVWHPVVWTDHVDLCDSSWRKDWGVVDISRGAVHASRMVQPRGWTRIFIRVVPEARIQRGIIRNSKFCHLYFTFASRVLKDTHPLLQRDEGEMKFHTPKPDRSEVIPDKSSNFSFSIFL